MQAWEVTQVAARSADSREGDGWEAVVAAAVDAAVAPDSVDDESFQHSKQVEVQFVAAVAVPIPMGYSDSNCTEAEEEVVVVVVAAAAVASAKAAVAVQIHFDLHFDWWNYLQMLELEGSWY